ncbi:hypothetical protein RHMOL_Rhmol03G0095300 [Rhododendron molle]|uniref:Uncharacterized protein n=1 Tax=Rhododendron molle TaxID=49168 RepID=A0ACC0PDF9_RHOML|nr:hypothetical protein RHMOL_Rhmol03G0095300 [Rhododendron molle]
MENQAGPLKSIKELDQTMDQVQFGFTISGLFSSVADFKKACNHTQKRDEIDNTGLEAAFVSGFDLKKPSKIAGRWKLHLLRITSHNCHKDMVFYLQLAADMQRFSRPERRINGPTITHLWSMLKLLDILVQLDHLKNAKASIPNDFSLYKGNELYIFILYSPSFFIAFSPWAVTTIAAIMMIFPLQFNESSVHGVNNELNIQDTMKHFDTMKHSSKSVMTNKIGPEVFRHVVYAAYTYFLEHKMAILLNLHVEMFRVNKGSDEEMSVVRRGGAVDDSIEYWWWRWRDGGGGGEMVAEVVVVERWRWGMVLVMTKASGGVGVVVSLVTRDGWSGSDSGGGGDEVVMWCCWLVSAVEWR